jgi:hypothetical protein
MDLLGEDFSEEGWEEIYDLMNMPVEDNLLGPLAAAAALPAVATGRPPRGAKRMTAYGYPTSREIAPEPYVPRPTRSRGKGFVPEAQRKRVCIDLTQEDEVYYEGELWPRGWRWGAEFVAIPNNGWVEVIEIN